MNPLPILDKNRFPLGGPARKNVLMVLHDPKRLPERLQQLLPFCDLYVVESGEAVLETLQKQADIGLLVSDLAVLTAAGYQLLKQLKTHPSYRHLPIINLGHQPQDHEKFTTFCASIHDFSLQEYEDEQFSILVKELLEREIEPQMGHNGVRSAYSSGKMLSRENITWMNHLECVVMLHLSHPNYNIADLAFEMHVSKSTLVRYVKQLFGLTPGEYITRIRMEKAKYFLENRKYPSVSQVSAAIGFQHLGAFSRRFYEYYGVRPSELMK